ncbi:MAG: hypothetical protein Q9220_001281 [cf. Caloplaca sp. 1 TL-2023]
MGCYDDGQNGGKANFPFKLDVVAGAAKSYPGYTSPANLTVEVCQTACRGHGFKYSGTYNGAECYCASRLPYPSTPVSGSTAGGLGAFAGTNPGGTVADSQCNVACPANSAETCGGPGTLQVYRDTSYAADTNPATLGVSQNYLYFGCYNNAGTGPAYLNIKTPSTVSCENYCGALGYTYSIRNTLDSNTGNNCGCGPELPGGLQIAETSCSRYCNGTTGAAGGAGTCGGNNAYSIYQNPNLRGCYLVRQPGIDASHTYAAPADAGVACTAPVCSGAVSSSTTTTSSTTSTSASSTATTTTTSSSSSSTSSSTLKFDFIHKLDLKPDFNFKLDLIYKFDLIHELDFNLKPDFKLKFDLIHQLDLIYKFDFDLKPDFKLKLDLKPNFNLKHNLELKFDFKFKFDFNLKLDFKHILPVELDFYILVFFVDFDAAIVNNFYKQCHIVTKLDSFVRHYGFLLCHPNDQYHNNANSQYYSCLCTHDDYDDLAFNYYAAYDDNDDLAFNDYAAHHDYDDLTFNNHAAYDDNDDLAFNDHAAYDSFDDNNLTHNDDYHMD